MGAISIAFDTTIVGALALPWLLLAFHLFFPDGEKHVSAVVDWIKKINQPAAVAVLLFAVAFFLGSAVSRSAVDFFNDDDLHLSGGDLGSPFHKHVLVRAGVTEDRILASVYCKSEDLLPARPADPALAAAIHDFKSHDCMCWQSLNWVLHLAEGQHEEDVELNDSAARIFGLEEGAPRLKGEDATSRLRTLHDQVMVLRGTAFNGLIAFALCLFTWSARIRRLSPASAWRWTSVAAPLFFFVLGGGLGRSPLFWRPRALRPAVYGVHAHPARSRRHVAFLEASASAG
jgi:hypothetical protein